MSTPRQIPISVVIPVKNEEKNLPRCLARLSRFAEIIVVDSSSTDRTPEIASEFGARYINFEWDGRYPKKRNWILINHQLDNEWVLFLDADELLDASVCDALDAATRQTDYSGYWLNYTNYFLGKPLRHGIPQQKLAFFRVGKGLYEKIDEAAWSPLDMEIHEHPIIDGDLGEIPERIDHDDYRGLAKFIERHKDYALWEANRYQTLKSAGADTLARLTKRQRFKYRHIASWWYPAFYFAYTYFVRLGCLDGRAGFAYAFYKFWYFYTIRLLIAEITSPSAHPQEKSAAASLADQALTPKS
ncbi:MAG: glycosyltransferase family 2 protein [Pseudomonadota bacterium]